MSDHDEQWLGDLGREIWPDPDAAYRQLLAIRVHRRRSRAGLGGIAAFAIAAALVTFFVLPKSHPTARGIVVGGGPAGSGPTATARSSATPLPQAPGRTTPTPTAPATGTPSENLLVGPPGAIVSATDSDGTDPHFTPATVTITVGETVRFVNTGQMAHSAVGANNTWHTGALATGPIEPGSSATTPGFETPGVYSYYCTYHRALGMVGTIVVLPDQSLGGPLWPIPAAVIQVTPTPSPVVAVTPISVAPPGSATGKIVPPLGANP